MCTCDIYCYYQINVDDICNNKYNLVIHTHYFEEGDKDRVLKAQEMLNDAQIDLKNVTAAQNNYQEIQEEGRADQPAELHDTDAHPRHPLFRVLRRPN